MVLRIFCVDQSYHIAAHGILASPAIQYCGPWFVIVMEAIAGADAAHVAALVGSAIQTLMAERQLGAGQGTFG